MSSIQPYLDTARDLMQPLWRAAEPYADAVRPYIDPLLPHMKRYGASALSLSCSAYRLTRPDTLFPSLPWLVASIALGAFLSQKDARDREVARNQLILQYGPDGTGSARTRILQKVQAKLTGKMPVTTPLPQPSEEEKENIQAVIRGRKEYGAANYAGRTGLLIGSVFTLLDARGWLPFIGGPSSAFASAMQLLQGAQTLHDLATRKQLFTSEITPQNASS